MEKLSEDMIDPVFQGRPYAGFKVAVCAAMTCAVTAVFAWDVEHDEIARLTGEALPAEIRTFFSFEDFGVLTGNCHFPDTMLQRPAGDPRAWRHRP